MGHKDILGNPLAVGDTVAFDVLSYKRSHLRIGTVTALADGHARIRYESSPAWGNEPPTVRGISKRSVEVAKVVRPE